MGNILVSGLINIEITLKVDGFPIPYFPVRYPFFGVSSTVSGVGYNIAKALTTLGAPVNFLSMTGKDAAAVLVQAALEADGIGGRGVLDLLDETPHSVILYDSGGRRQINVDLKDIQDRAYPLERYDEAARACDLAVLCNINFSRPMLARAAAAGIPIATDVHAVADLESDYDRDFTAHADILFMSDERLPCPPAEWVRRVQNRYKADIIVIGMGGRGALLAVRSDDRVEHIPAVHTRDVVNTIGAGDALFSAFVYTYHQTRNPYLAIRKATVFASYKVGARGAADGFLTARELDAIYEPVKSQLS
jgi:ribokinase